MRNLTMGIILVLLCTLLSRAFSEEEEKNTPVVGTVGASADLPCDVDVPNCGKVRSVTWTKDVRDKWKKVYLYGDGVDKPLRHLADPDRADFYLKKGAAFLRIRPLMDEDDGVYRCNVTYKKAKCTSMSYATLITFVEDKDEVPEIQHETLENNEDITETVAKTVEEEDVEEDDTCSLPLDPGPCFALVEKFHFDGKKCEIFQYSGCGGNNNNFDTLDDCNKACPKKNKHPRK